MPPLAIVDTHRPLWAGPLWIPLDPCGPGPCGPPWANVGHALVGALGPCGLSPCGPPWALVRLARVGPLGHHGPGPNGPLLGPNRPGGASLMGSIMGSLMRGD